MTIINAKDLLQKLAQHGIAAHLVGDDRNAEHFCSLRAPEEGGVFYVTGKIDTLPQIRHAILLCDRVRADIDLSVNSLLVTSNPQLAFYVAQREYLPPKTRSGVHPSAVIDPSATIHPSAYIGPFCVIGEATIGANCILDSHVVVRDGVILQEGVTIESHSTLGATGVAWVWDQSNDTKVVQPQTGGVLIGRNSFIGSDVTIVRGSINEVSSIGADCLIAHGTKIGHGCQIDALVHFANNVTIAGSVTIGREAFLGAGCVVRPHVMLPRGTIVGAGAVVVSAPPTEYTTIVGVPARAMGKVGAQMTGVPERKNDHKRGA